MRIDFAYELDRAAEKSPLPWRQHLTCINVTTWKPWGTNTAHQVAMAADGLLAVVVPVTMEPGDVEGLVPAARLKVARRDFRGKKADGLPLDLRKAARDWKEDYDMPFPDLYRVVPPATPVDQVFPVVGLDVRILDRLGKALGSSVLVFRRQSLGGPLLVKPDDAMRRGMDWLEPPFGIVMPAYTDQAAVGGKGGGL